jgi:two-component system, chemotaxis family, chemotaxis protein CheY
MSLHDESRILIVDDVNTMRTQIRELLKAFGFQHLTMVSNGEEAKVELSKNHYDLILCDWHMEPCDGLQLLKYVREAPNFKAIAFVLITAESTKDRVVEAIRAGVDDYLIKPLTRVQIETKVYSVLLKKRAEHPT